MDCPAASISITPPAPQNNKLFFPNTGEPFIITVGEPTVHGAVKAGMHALVPSHMTNPGILMPGLLSMIFATGVADMHRFVGRTVKTDSAAPFEHFIGAPLQTTKLISIILSCDLGDEIPSGVWGSAPRF